MSSYHLAMRFFHNEDVHRVLVFLMFGTLTACPSKSDPHPEPAHSSPLPIVEIPSASASAHLESNPPIPSATASNSATPIPSAPIETSIDPETVTAVLVWQKDPKAAGGFRTQWVEKDSDKSKVIAERPGMIAWSTSSLWTYDTTIVKGCSLIARNDQGEAIVQNGQPARGRSDMKMPEFVRMTDGARVAPWKDGHGYPYMGTQCDPAMEDYSIDVFVEGGMGPFIVTRVRTYMFAGGAHGIHGEDIFPIDLEQQKKVMLKPRQQDQEALLKNAAKGLNAESKEVTYSGLFLLYGPNGAGLAIYRYWASASYAEGIGGNSYSNDFEVSSKIVPPEVSGFAKLPAWATSLMKPKPLPIFMIPATSTARFKTQFDSAYAQP